jgi:integrase
MINSIEVYFIGKYNETLIFNESERDEARALMATIFETGARVSEVLGQPTPGGLDGLRCRDINIGENMVNVVFNIAKRYRKIGEAVKYKAIDGVKLRWNTEDEAKKSGHKYKMYLGFSTKRVVDIRNVAFPTKEPLTPYIINWVKKIKEEKGDEIKLFTLHYNRFYRIIKRAGELINEDFPPHRLRAERATCLALNYNFTDHELMEWFSWKTSEVAQTYTTLAPRYFNKMFKFWE